MTTPKKAGAAADAAAAPAQDALAAAATPLEHPRRGGSYRRQKDGSLQLIEGAYKVEPAPAVAPAVTSETPAAAATAPAGDPQQSEG